MTNRISFAVVVALLLGWGILSLLVIQGQQTGLNSDLYTIEQNQPLPKGVRLKLDVDKKVYQPGEMILISLRNDSSKNVKLAKQADACAPSWWVVQQLVNGDTWQTYGITAVSCSSKPLGLLDFPKHTINNDQWGGSTAAGQLGNVSIQSPTGTYRIYVPYLFGPEIKETDWPTAKSIVSPSFTLQ